MKISFDGSILTIKTSDHVLECNESEEGIVISPVDRNENFMELSVLDGGKETKIKGNIMWIKVKKVAKN